MEKCVKGFYDLGVVRGLALRHYARSRTDPKWQLRSRVGQFLTKEIWLIRSNTVNTITFHNSIQFPNNTLLDVYSAFRRSHIASFTGSLLRNLFVS